MNIVTQTHLTSNLRHLQTILEQVAHGIVRWCKGYTGPSKELVTSVVVTDDIDFANTATETNDVVILISHQPETVREGVSVCDVPGIATGICERLLHIQRRHSH
ncbi:MAG: hypothetical protein AAB610_01935 [Patescibacteria group bacterium]